jgi:hypothetical protein
MARKNSRKNNNHKYMSYLVKDYSLEDGQRLVITHYLSDGGKFDILSEFIFPTVDMVLKKCKKGAKRSPNSFIIFRMFFNQSIKIEDIPPSDVGGISRIAKAVWRVVSDNLKKDFVSLEENVKNSLRKIRSPSFIMHNESDRNRKTRRHSNSFPSHGLSESFRNEKNGSSLDSNNIVMAPEPSTYLPFMENLPVEVIEGIADLQYLVPTTSNCYPTRFFVNDLDMVQSWNPFVDYEMKSTANFADFTNGPYLYDIQTTGTFFNEVGNNQTPQQAEILPDNTGDFLNFVLEEEICKLDFNYHNQKKY